MSTLLIGGGGLIGPVLVEKMLEAKENLVVYSAHPPQKPLPDVRYYIGDVCEYGLLDRIYRENSIDRVIHNAGVSSPKLYPKDPYKICRVNVDGVLTSLEMAYEYGVSRFVYISTAGVYDPAFAGEIDEATPRRATALYRATKIACEELVRNYGIRETVSLRVSFVYGRGRTIACPIRELVRDLRQKGAVCWERGCDQLQDYIHVTDVAEGIRSVVLAGVLSGKEYNIGGGQAVRFDEIVETVRRRYPGKKIQVGTGDLGFSPAVLSIERMHRDFGWSPKVDFATGLEDYLNWLDTQVSLV